MAADQYKAIVHDVFVKLQKYCEARHTNIKTVFKIMGSRNKVKGELDRGQLQAVLTQLLGKELSAMEWDALMKALDENGDGTIEYKELFDAIWEDKREFSRGVGAKPTVDIGARELTRLYSMSKYHTPIRGRPDRAKKSQSGSMDGFLPLRAYSHLPATSENPMSASSRKSGTRSKSTAPPPLTGAPKQFWDMMWMDTNKKRSGAKKQSRSHSQAMSRTASEWGDAPEGPMAGSATIPSRLSTPWLFKSGRDHYDKTKSSNVAQAYQTRADMHETLGPTREDADERLLRLAKEDKLFLARVPSGPPKMTHRAALEREANDNAVGRYRSQRSNHPTQAPPRVPRTPGGTLKPPVDEDLTGTEGPGRYSGMIQGGVDPTPRPLTDLHGVRRSTFKYKKMPAVIMQGLGLKP